MSGSSMLDGKKILIVDDEPDVLEVLEEFLRNNQNISKKIEGRLVYK